MLEINKNEKCNFFNSMNHHQHGLYPDQWKWSDWRDLKGVVMVIGAPDVGKTTFSHFLFRQIIEQGEQSVAILDGDPGQSSLGPPTTMTITSSIDKKGSSKSETLVQRMFLGSTSPRGHMLPLLVAASRLVSYAQSHGFQLVIYDTSGLIAIEQGGLSLKSAKIDLLQPAALIAIQENEELEPLLVPYKRSGRVKIFNLGISKYVIQRETKIRQKYRINKFREYFKDSNSTELYWNQIAVFPFPRFNMNRLVALESQEGFLLALGIIIDINREKRKLKIMTPLYDIAEVNAIRIGDIDIDPISFADRKI